MQDLFELPTDKEVSEMDEERTKKLMEEVMEVHRKKYNF